MQHIGDFGTARPLVDAEFGYFGERIRVNPEVSDLDIADLMAQYGDVDSDTMAAEMLVGARDRMIAFVHEDDRELFWDLARANRQVAKDIMKVSHAVMEAVSDFPTGHTPDSSTGQPSTVERFAGVSSNRATRRAAARRIRKVGTDAHQEPIPPAVLADALRALDGRPDKQLGLLQLHHQMGDPEERRTG